MHSQKGSTPCTRICDNMQQPCDTFQLWNEPLRPNTDTYPNTLLPRAWCALLSSVACYAMLNCRSNFAATRSFELRWLMRIAWPAARSNLQSRLASVSIRTCCIFWQVPTSSSSVLQSSEELLYRCNLADQFRDLHLPRAEHTQATEASKRRTERMLIRNPPLGRLGLSEESVVVHCMEAHFKARVQTDAMYSLPASPGVFAGVQGSLQGILGASLASRLAVASQVSPSPFELDVEAVHAPTPRQELNFCRVLH